MTTFTTPQVNEEAHRLGVAEMRKKGLRAMAAAEGCAVTDLKIYDALPPREWIDVDPTLRKIEEDAAPIYATLRRNTYRVPIETEEVEYWQGKDLDGAQSASNLSALASALKSDGGSQALVREPLTAIGKAWHLDFEQMLSDRNKRAGMLESFMDMRAMRKMTEKEDEVMLDGDSNATTKDGTKALTGLRNSTGVFATTPDGNLSTGGGSAWINSLIKMRQTFISNNVQLTPGRRITVFVNDEDWNELAKDYSTQYIQTIEDRLMSVGGFAEFVQCGNINRNEMIGVINTSEYVRVVEALPTTMLAIQRLDVHERFEMQYRKKFGLCVLRDINNKTGVCRMTS